jgi:hypothetical protein
MMEFEEGKKICPKQLHEISAGPSHGSIRAEEYSYSALL